MKVCEYCGRENTDDATECPECGTTVSCYGQLASATLESGSECSPKKPSPLIGLRPFIIPAIMWGYILSVVLAKTFWGDLFQKLVEKADLTPNQGFWLLVLLNFGIAAIGVPQVMAFVHVLRRRGMPVSISRHLAAGASIAAIFICSAAALLGIVQLRKTSPQTVAASAAKERLRIFEARTARG
jgi:hypothetical protein